MAEVPVAAVLAASAGSLESLKPEKKQWGGGGGVGGFGCLGVVRTAGGTRSPGGLFRDFGPGPEILCRGEAQGGTKISEVRV